ncbi:hypothetical protein [Methylobacterium segetis]|uniref:hypothetical protein n=1 Tax=Methylobacterium segetis TaxID=2488750 RepID=UPI001044573F|nr:hypothetical protein [Methylobacterium segetis]
MDQLAGALAFEVNNVPARFSRDLDKRERLQVEIDDVLKTAASRIQKCGAALRAGLDADSPEGKDGP